VSAEAFIDYYELLQVSPNADEDTIQRVFRHLAKKHHPDASAGGDPVQFNRLLDAYRTLTDASRRAAYDVAHRRHWEQTWRVAGEAAKDPVSNDATCRDRLLALLYSQRRQHVRRPGMGEVDMARVMDLPSEYLEFHLWYLREKGWIQRLDTGYLAITAEGVDQVERRRVELAPDRLIEARPDEPADGVDPSAHSPQKS
jgi:curved DNA-binding protein CbpA